MKTARFDFATNAKQIRGELYAMNAQLQNVNTSLNRMNAVGAKSASGHTKHSSALKGLALRFVGYNLILNTVMGAQQKMIEFIKESVGAFREFETRLAEISTIMGADLKPQLLGLGIGIENLSMKYGQATSDMSKGLYDILSAAFATEDAINLLNTATKASIAGLSEVRTSVSIFTGVLNAYGKSIEQAAHVSDVLFQSVIRGKFQFADLESALGYIIPIAAQAGIAFDELMASLSTATRHGLHLDMTSRGLAMAIQNIINPSTQAAAAADKYGIEMNGLALRVMGLHGWFEELNLAIKEFGTHIMGELIPNIRSLRVAMVLASDVGLEGFNEDLRMLAKMGNATEKALLEIMNTSQFVSNQLTQQWEKVKREVGDKWDELMIGIQSKVLAIADFLGGQEFVSDIGEQFVVSDDAIANAEKYLEIRHLIAKKEKEHAALGKEPDIGYWGRLLEQFDLSPDAPDSWERLTAEIIALDKTSAKFVDYWNEVTSGIQDSIEVIGNLQITLDNVALSIEQFEEKLRKPIEFGWGGTQAEMGLENLKGTLYYEYEILKAEQKYADVTHDVSMGLKMKNYQYKELSASMQENVKYVREYQEAQEANRRATQEMTEALRLLQIQMLEIQLKGMIRRRGLTRNEQKQLKALQIEQAKARLENMRNVQQAEVDDVTVTIGMYNERKDIIDNYLLKKKEEQYQIKYIYDQQIADFARMLDNEETKLQNRYTWWEETNQKIIDNTADALEAFEGFSDSFKAALLEEGIDVAKLEEAYRNLNAARRGEEGKYTTPSKSKKDIFPKPKITDADPELQRIIDVSPPRFKKLFGFQRGMEYVPETMPAIIHRGETISPAGRESANRCVIVENLTIAVKDFVEFDDIEKFASMLRTAENAGLINKKGRSTYRSR